MNESPEDIYADFAERYDRFCGPIGEPAPVRLAFFRQLFAQHQVQSVLDCACGTGRDLILFRALAARVGNGLVSIDAGTSAKELGWAGIENPPNPGRLSQIAEGFPPTI